MDLTTLAASATLPNDWRTIPLGKMLKRPPTYGINARSIPLDSRHPTYIRITDITADSRFADDSKASVDHPAAPQYQLEDGDLVFARTGASVGKSYLYSAQDGDLVFAGFLIRISPNPKVLLPAYLAQFVRTEQYWAWIKQNSMRSGQPGINGQEYATLPVPLPPTTAEQEAITEALSDADAYIESLERLIAKKRLVMQGAMQELLTGKRRLEGFTTNETYRQTDVGPIPADWCLAALGEIANIKTGERNNEDKVDDAPYPFFVRSPKVERIDRFSHDCEAILVPGEGNIGNVFHYINGRFNVHQRVYAITGFDADVAPKFLYFYMAAYFGSHAMKNSVKATVDSLRLPTFKQFQVAMPATSTEQRAIATVLTDMETAIDELESKLGKARDVKQGMVQSLLTGKVRLV
jgi:type I restriction enzyme S subunit